MKAIMAETDALSKLGVHLIRWAGFNTITGNEFTNQHFSDCQLTTETFSKMLTSFKCSLKSEHRSHCFRYVRNLGHSAFSAPHLDPDFLNLVVEKEAAGSKEAFGEVINPLDEHLLTLQISLLKCAHPMFLACNEYELDLKQGSDSRTQLFTALAKTISLCRKTLVLLGISYSLTSSFRQDRILEAVDLKDEAPKPSDFPNLEDSYLFGKEYLTKLRNWVDKSGHPVKLTYDLLTPEEKQQQVLQAKMQEEKGERTADPETVQTIDKLLEYNVKNWRLKGNDDGKPQFWFLFDETSAEYKYYRFKMLEMQKLKRATMDAKVQADAYRRSPQDMADESVRAMILARKTSALKKKLFRDLAMSKKRRIRRAMASTQTDLNMSQVQELLTQVEHSTPKQCTASDAENAKALTPDTSAACLQFSEVDINTKETAENLARFLVEMGQELRGFNLDVLSNNPEFWFMKEKESSAYKYYYMKLTEFRQASGLTYDPHASSNQAEAGTQDPESKSLKRQKPNPPDFKPLVPGFYDSDSEHVERQDPTSRISGSLVSYFSDSGHSDAEDPSDPNPKHNKHEHQSFVSGDSALKSLHSKDQKLPISISLAWKSQLQDRKFPSPLTQPSVTKGQKPDLLLPQYETHQSLPPQGREPEIRLSQEQKTQSQEQSLPSPEPVSQVLLSKDRESDNPLSQDQASEIALSKEQVSQIPLPQEPKHEPPLSQNREPGNQSSQVEPGTNLPKGQEQMSWIEVEKSPLLCKDDEPPQARDRALQQQDQRSQSTLPNDREPFAQYEKSQPLRPIEQRPETSLPQGQGPPLQEQSTHFQDPRFPPPRFQDRMAPPTLFREQEMVATLPPHQKPQPQYQVQHPEDQKSKPPHAQEQRSQLFFPTDKPPQSGLSQGLRLEHPVPQAQTPYPPYPNPQPLPPQNWMFQSQDHMNKQALPRYYNPRIPPPQVPTYLPPGHQMQIPQLSVPRGQMPPIPIPQVLHQGQKLPVPQEWKPRLPLPQVPMHPHQDQRPQGPLLQGLTPQFPLPHERIPPHPLAPVRNPQDLKSQSPYFLDQKPQPPLHQDLGPRLTLQQGQNPQHNLLQHPKPHLPLAHDWKSQDLQYQPTRLPDQKPSLPLLQDQNTVHLPQDQKAWSLDQTAQLLFPQDQKPQLPLLQVQKPQLSLVQDQKPQIPLPQEKKPQLSPAEEQKPQFPLLQDEKPHLSLAQEQKPQLPLLQDEKPQLSLTQEQKPQLPLLQDPQAQLRLLQDEKPQLSLDQDQKPQLPLLQDEKPQLSLDQDQKPEIPLAQDQMPQLSLDQEQTSQHPLPQDQKPQDPMPEMSLVQDQKPHTPKNLPKDQKLHTPLPPNQKPPTSLSQNPKASNLLPQDWNLHISVRKLMLPPTDTQKSKTSLPQDQKLKQNLSQDQTPLRSVPQDGKPQTSETQNQKSQTSASMNEEPRTPAPHDLNVQTPRPQNLKTQITLPNIQKHPSLLNQDRKPHNPQNAKSQTATHRDLKRQSTSPQNLKCQTPVLQSQTSRLSLSQDRKHQISLAQNQKTQILPPKYEKSQPLFPIEPESQVSHFQNQKSDILLGENRESDPPLKRAWKSETSLPQHQKPHAPLFKIQRSPIPLAQYRKSQPLVPQKEMPETPDLQTQEPVSPLTEPLMPHNPLHKHQKTETSVFLNRKSQTAVSQEKNSQAHVAQGQKALSQDRDSQDCVTEDFKTRHSSPPFQKQSTSQHCDSRLGVPKDFKPVVSEAYSFKPGKHEYSEDSDSEGLGPVLPEFKPRSSLVKSSKHKRSKRVHQESSPEIREEKESKSSKKTARKKAKRRKRSASPAKSPHRRKRGRSPKVVSVSSKNLSSDEEVKVRGKAEVEQPSGKHSEKKKQSIQAPPIITKWPDMETFSQDRGYKEGSSLLFGGRVVRDPASTSRPFGMENLIVTVRRANPAQK